MIYVHVPFCGSFCTYCDFYSEILCAGRDALHYTDEVCREIEGRRDSIRATREVNTLYFGGGTPSVLPLDCLARIARAARGCVESDFTEFTVEVNPEDIVRGGEPYVRGLLSLGVNRISMGVQSLDDKMLGWMHRRHSSEGAREAFRILRAAGVPNVSVDVIFGISHLADDVLLETVREIVSMGPEHISAYQLSIEEGSALGAMVLEGSYKEASDEQCRRQYGLICDELRKAGYVHYEISNWALPGFEAQHNSAYWERKPYVGVGPGAHSLQFVQNSEADCTPVGAIKRGNAPSGVQSASAAPAGSAVQPVAADCGSRGALPRFNAPLGSQSATGETATTVVQRRSWNSQELSGWTASSEVLTPEEILEEEVMLGLRTLKGWNDRILSEEEWFVSDDIISDIMSKM